MQFLQNMLFHELYEDSLISGTFIGNTEWNTVFWFFLVQRDATEFDVFILIH